MSEQCADSGEVGIASTVLDSVSGDCCSSMCDCFSNCCEWISEQDIDTSRPKGRRKKVKGSKQTNNPIVGAALQQIGSFQQQPNGVVHMQPGHAQPGQPGIQPNMTQNTMVHGQPYMMPLPPQHNVQFQPHNPGQITPHQQVHYNVSGVTQIGNVAFVQQPNMTQAIRQPGPGNVAILQVPSTG